MAQQTINIGSSPNKGDGDPLRTAFNKVNDNFTELYARELNTDAQTLALVGDTLSISGGNSVTLTSTFSGDYNDLTNKPTIPAAVSELTNDAGYITLAEVTGEITVNPTGDLQGSVFADDSTLLVDGVNASIPYSVLSDAPTALSSFANDLDYAAIVGTAIQNNGLPANTVLTGDLVAQSNSIVNANLIGATGDISGSVFADDSTLLVDGVSGSIPYSVLSDAPNIPSGSSISNGTTQINIPNEDGSIEIDGDVELYGGLDIHSGGAPLGQNDIVFFGSGNEIGRITTAGETGGAIQIQVDPIFEVKVSNDDGQGEPEIALWRFSSDGNLELPEGGNIPGYVKLEELKTLTSESSDFDDFKARIAAL